MRTAILILTALIALPACAMDWDCEFHTAACQTQPRPAESVQWPQNQPTRQPGYDLACFKGCRAQNLKVNFCLSVCGE